MNDFDDKRYKGHGKDLDAAFKAAWEKAKEEGAPPGVYKVDISIETENPIRGYIVVITPGD